MLTDSSVLFEGVLVLCVCDDLKCFIFYIRFVSLDFFFLSQKCVFSLSRTMVRGLVNSSVCLCFQELVMEMTELPSITRFLPKILLAVTVSTCDEIYKKIALWLNDMGKMTNISKVTFCICGIHFSRQSKLVTSSKSFRYSIESYEVSTNASVIPTAIQEMHCTVQNGRRKPPQNKINKIK